MNRKTRYLLGTTLAVPALLAANVVIAQDAAVFSLGREESVLEQLIILHRVIVQHWDGVELAERRRDACTPLKVSLRARGQQCG